MSRPRPMFPFYGAKWRAAPKYPEPNNSLIIEPFAGSACYAMHYHKGHDVWINDLSETVYGVWKYLQDVSKNPKLRKEFLNLPVDIDSVDDARLKNAPQGAKDLIGFWFTKAAKPAKEKVGWARKGTDSYDASYARQYWSQERKARIAKQIPIIEKWTITNKDYREIENKKATWFVDPPYQGVAGKAYECNNDGFDYTDLLEWCKERKGQLLVCESNNQTWAPFNFDEFGDFKSVRKKKHTEMLWERS